MTDTEVLLLVLAGLYAIECGLWVPRGHVAVYSRIGRRHRLARADELFGNQRGGILVVSPLPGVGRAFLCREPEDGAVGVLDIDAVRDRVTLFERHAWAARLSGAALLALVTIVAPLAVWRLGWLRSALPLIVLLVALVAMTVVSFVVAHRRLYPTERAARRTRAVVFALSPLAAMRAGDELAHNLLRDVDPLAAVLVLGDRAGSLALARRRLYDAGCRASVGKAVTTGPARPLIAALRQAGLTVEEVLAPPAPDSPEACAFCPRCHAQHTCSAGTCDTCSDVILERFTA
jgi:hypothetical protein